MRSEIEILRNIDETSAKKRRQQVVNGSRDEEKECSWEWRRRLGRVVGLVGVVLGGLGLVGCGRLAVLGRDKICQPNCDTAVAETISENLPLTIGNCWLQFI